MKVELQKISLDEKDVIRNLMQFYLYDYSDTDKRDINSWGLFEYEYLDSYFEGDEKRVPFFIKLNNIVVGFLLMNNHSIISGDEKIKSIAEFFVMKKYRRIGIGSSTLRTVFEMFPGEWEIKVDKKNKIGLKFWRKNIKEITGGKFVEKYIDSEKLTGYLVNFKI